MQRLSLIELDAYWNGKKGNGVIPKRNGWKGSISYRALSFLPPFFYHFFVFRFISLPQYFSFARFLYSYLYGVAHDYAHRKEIKKRRHTPTFFASITSHGTKMAQDLTATRYGHYGMQMMNAAGRRHSRFLMGANGYQFLCVRWGLGAH